VKCWAESVSDCSGNQSREHYITKGLFSGKSVKVSGAPFLNGEERIISKASLTRKCLCSKHNSLLSPFDKEAINFAKSLEYAHKLSLERSADKRKKLPVHHKYSDADAFSRWIIKTYINMLEFFPKPSLIEEHVLANLVFARGKVTKHLSYRVSMDVGDEFQISETVGVAPLINCSDTVGLSIWIYGINIQCLIHDSPVSNGKLPKLKFNENGKGLSCVVGLK
jgi:hypothetical protein